MQDLVAIVVAGPDIGVRTALGAGAAVGSAPGSDLPLTDPAIADRHLRIFREGDELRVEGLASSHPVRLNGEPLERARGLRMGDQLLLGATVLEVVSAETAAAGAPKRTGLRIQPTAAAFVPPEFLEDASTREGRSRYGALGSWTDSRVKLQTQIAAFGLLSVSAVAVYLFAL